MVLLIDNYDSFVYNLAQYIGELGWEPVVYRHDAITLEEIEELAPSHIVISPGPGTPLDAGISNDVISRYGGRIPILGVCLGHQCIGHVYGAGVDRAEVPMHGKTALVHHDGETIYTGVPSPFPGGRYHSLVVYCDKFPECLDISATTEDGIIMGIRHKQYVVEGIQFHPESIMTGVGHTILRNFLSIAQPLWTESST
jgi:para-aminobenzoate synthetase component 2